MAPPLLWADLSSFVDKCKQLCEAPKAKSGLLQFVQWLKQRLGRLMVNGISPNGQPYAPLSPVTIALTPDRLGGPLINTGAMLESVDRDGPGHIEAVTADSAVLGTGHEKDGKPIAAWHQEGTRRMPARPFIGYDEHSIDWVMELVANDILDQISKF